MPRLLRPTPPIKNKCQAAMQQLGELFPDRLLVEHHRRHGKLLAELLDRLAQLFGCEVADLWLDHDPALENRPKIYRNGIHVDYEPPANDPSHLRYRPQAPNFDKSHYVKTYIRGDHGQHSDAALARKNKRIAKKREKPKGSQRLTQNGKRGGALGAGWGANRPLRSANRLPGKGMVKFNRKKP